MGREFSFANWARLTPRERMLHALNGNGAATFGLEVGSPRGQLGGFGVIPMRGLGLLSQELTKIDNSLDPMNAVSVQTAPVDATATYVAPAPTSTTMLAPAPSTTTILTTSEPAPTYTLDRTVSPGATYYGTTETAVPASTTSVYTPTQEALPNVAQEDAPTEQLVSDQPNNTSNFTDGEYDYASEGSRAYDEPYDQFTDYEGQGDQAQGAWGADAGGGAGGGGAASQVTSTAIAARTKIKTPITAAQGAMEAAQRNWKWIAGGVVLAGAAYYFGKKKG